MIRKIGAQIKSKSKSFLLNLVIRTVWSVLVSTLLTFLVTFVLMLLAGAMGVTRALSQILLETFGELFIFFFSLSFPVLVLIYMVQAIMKLEWEGELEFSRRLGDRLRALRIETRLAIENGAKWTSRFSMLIAFVILFTWLGATVMDDRSLDLWAYPLVLTAFFIFVVSIGLRDTLMTQFDWAIFHFEEFARDREGGVLVRDHLINAFRNYNRLLGSSIPMNRLSQLCGFTIAAYKIGDDAGRKQMDEKIIEIIQRLKNKEVNQANRCLIQLAESATEITKRHEELVGLKIRYPVRYRLGDLFRGTLNKIMIPFALFLLYILVWIILSHFGLFPMIPQSPPF